MITLAPDDNIASHRRCGGKWCSHPVLGFVARIRFASPPPAEMAARLPAALKAAKYVYVRRDGTIRTFEPLYPGPFRGTGLRAEGVLPGRKRQGGVSLISGPLRCRPLVDQCVKGVSEVFRKNKKGVCYHPS